MSHRRYHWLIRLICICERGRLQTAISGCKENKGSNNKVWSPVDVLDLSKGSVSDKSIDGRGVLRPEKKIETNEETKKLFLLYLLVKISPLLSHLSWYLIYHCAQDIFSWNCIIDTDWSSHNIWWIDLFFFFLFIDYFLACASCFLSFKVRLILTFELLVMWRDSNGIWGNRAWRDTVFQPIIWIDDLRQFATAIAVRLGKENGENNCFSLASAGQC